MSLGRRQPLVYPWDERDMRHTAKLMAYLWAAEEGLFEEFERNLFIESIRPNGDFLMHGSGTVSPYVLHVAMYSAGAADFGWCRGIMPQRQRTVLGNIVKLVQRTHATFDPEGSGFLSVGAGEDWHTRGFWGTFLGEPTHFPANFDGRNKLVIAGMALAVFTKRFRDAARELAHPRRRRWPSSMPGWLTPSKTAPGATRTVITISTRRQRGPLVLEHERPVRREPRDGCRPLLCRRRLRHSRTVRAVGRVLHRGVVHDRVFPMPTRWPTYSWYSPGHPNGADQGDDSSQIGGAWDTPYFHCVALLERLGLQQALQRAVLRRAEAIHRDQDCLENYYADGTIDTTRFYSRDQYIVSATAHVSAIIEGLFGITPARTGFAEVNLRPNLPLYRRHRHSTHPSDWSGRDNRICVRLGAGDGWR